MSANPRLLGLSTAVPPHRLGQEEVRGLAMRLFEGVFPDLDRLLPIYGNAAIRTRYSCVPLEWYQADHSFSERNRLYVDHAVALLESAALDCLDRSDMSVDDVDTLIVVSTSGIATPSLDARLMERLGVRRTVQRLPVFGLGCAGAVLGLGRAAALSRAEPERNILFLVVELCGLTFRRRDHSKSNFVATALFGDGAAAMLVSGTGDGPQITAWGEYTWPQSLDVMGWRIEDDGFGVLFSRDIPTFVRTHMLVATANFLSEQGLTLKDIDSFVCHPGGAKVLDALEEVFCMEPGGLIHSRGVLRDFGNMSAATVPFVLERALAAGGTGRHLLTALGPGFTAGFAIVESP